MLHSIYNGLKELAVLVGVEKGAPMRHLKLSSSYSRRRCSTRLQAELRILSVGFWVRTARMHTGGRGARKRTVRDGCSMTRGRTGRKSPRNDVAVSRPARKVVSRVPSSALMAETRARSSTAEDR